MTGSLLSYDEPRLIERLAGITATKRWDSALLHLQPLFMVKFMNMKLRLRISKGGQVSIPARIRHRWGTSTVALSDEGHRVVLEPAADDPIAAAEGALAAEFGKLDLRRLRREAREDEGVAEARHDKR